MPINPQRKFTDDDCKDVVKTFDDTREEQSTRYSNFEEDMRAAGRNLSPPKLKAQKKKIWGVRPDVRKIKAIVENLWAPVDKAKTIGKSCVHEILKKFGKYPEEDKKKPEKFQRPSKLGDCYCIDTGACFIGDKTQIHFQPIFDEGSEVARPPPTLQVGAFLNDEECPLCHGTGYINDDTIEVRGRHEVHWYDE